MAIFGPKPWLNPFGKMSIFPLFGLLVSYRVQRRFFALQYRKRYFPGLHCLKKKLEKWPFFDQNRGLTPLEKFQLFDFWTSGFYRLGKRFFVLEYHKRYFPGLYCLKKKKVAKMAIFGPKRWVNPF